MRARGPCASTRPVSTLTLACARTPTPTASPPPPIASTPAPTPEPAPAPEPAPVVDTLPPATGDSLTLARHECYGPCPIYTLTLFTSGRVEWHGQAHVTRTGHVATQMDPAVINELLAAAEALDLDRIPRDRTQVECGNDLPATSLTLRRGATTRTVHIDAACLVRFCDDHGERCDDRGQAKRLAKLGLSREAMAAAELLAGRIDAAAATTKWVADPDCRNPTRLGLDFGPPPTDDITRQVHEGLYAKIVATLQADPDTAVRISSLAYPDADTVLTTHETLLRKRGVAATRISRHVRRSSYEEPALEGVVFQLGPAKCFGAAAIEP